MNWNGRSAWIYEGTVPDLLKISRYGIQTVYVDPRSDNAAAVIQLLAKSGITPGAYFARSWQSSMTAIELAAWINQQLNKLLPRPSTGEAPPAMLDVEGSSLKFATDFIASYRSHQPNRPTAYTNAPFQGNYIPYSSLRTYKMPFYVQLYYGNMRPADASRAILESCRGYADATKVFPFYDGAAWAVDQIEGCYFTFERLP